jgi:hypothetical protein
MLRKIAPAIVVTALAALPLLAAPTPAFAHDDIDVGTYTLAVGFGEEPAYVGQPNSVQLLLSKGEEPVTDVGDTLDVEVTFGDQPGLDLSFEPFFEVGEFGTPGDYRAWFIPTSAGQYTFHITGKIDGTTIDETATSGPKTFSDVETGTDLQYPVKQPTITEVGERIDREVPRLNTAIERAAGGAASASDRASSAKTLGIVGIVVGALGLAVGATALATSRRRA